MDDKRYPRTILATVCIPWTNSYKFDESIFRSHVRSLIKRRINNIYIFGTAGEGYAVTEEQFDGIVKVFADEMKHPDLYPMVGLISLSFPNIMQRLQRAYAYGIRNFQFSLPSWGVLSDGELFSYVHQLCNYYPDCRFFHYNLLRSKRLLGIREYKRLAEEIPNFVGAKFSTSDISTIIDIADNTCPLRFFLTEEGFGYGSMVGEFGFLISVASSNINRAWEYFDAAVSKRMDILLTMQQELHFMTKRLLNIVKETRIDGAYDKIFCKILNNEFPLRLLPPYESASDEEFLQYLEFLKKEYPQWLE